MSDESGTSVIGWVIGSIILGIMWMAYSSWETDRIMDRANDDAKELMRESTRETKKMMKELGL